MRQQTTIITYEKSQATSAHIDRSNKYLESEANSSTQDFQYQLASKALSQGSTARD
jgi:hypothetical protein